MRNIFVINANQVVTSDSHPEGAFSTVNDFPKTVDSRTYGGNIETALIVAQAEYADEVKTLTTANNANRVMWTVTLSQADGRLLAHKSAGAFPAEPEPEEPAAE